MEQHINEAADALGRLRQQDEGIKLLSKKLERTGQEKKEAEDALVDLGESWRRARNRADEILRKRGAAEGKGSNIDEVIATRGGFVGEREERG